MLLSIIQETNVPLSMKVKSSFTGENSQIWTEDIENLNKWRHNVHICVNPMWQASSFPKINPEFNAISIKIPTQLLLAFITV